MAAVQTALLSDTFRHTGILQPHLKKKTKNKKKDSYNIQVCIH